MTAQVSSLLSFSILELLHLSAFIYQLCSQVASALQACLSAAADGHRLCRGAA